MLYDVHRIDEKSWHTKTSYLSLDTSFLDSYHPVPFFTDNLTRSPTHTHKLGALRTHSHTQTPRMKRTLEVCVDNADDLAAAVAGGAGRIELCAALGVGGLTPAGSLMRRAGVLQRHTGVPVYAMVRPHAGGDLAWSVADTAQMLDDIDCARDAGLAGVVLGACCLPAPASGGGTQQLLDMATLRLLAARARSAGLGTTLHRAFDLAVSVDPDADADAGARVAEAVAAAVELGFERILTSGGRATAAEGLAVLRRARAAARGRIAIMPGAGIHAGNAALFAEFDQLHASCSVPVPVPAGGSRGLELGFGEQRVLSPASLRDLLAAMDAMP